MSTQLEKVLRDIDPFDAEQILKNFSNIARIIGDPFALATISISIVSDPLSLSSG